MSKKCPAVWRSFEQARHGRGNMTQADIKLKIKHLEKEKKQFTTKQHAIYAKIAVIDKKILNVQKKCNHPNLIRNHIGGDYYSKAYSEFYCPDCKITNK